jgi:hypothetical protein
MPPRIDIVYELDIVPLQVDGVALPITLAAQLQPKVIKPIGVSDLIKAGRKHPGHFPAVMRSLDTIPISTSRCAHQSHVTCTIPELRSK